MKIGIIGTGHIGKTLVIRLSEAGHQVKVANSRGPQSIEADLLINGAQPATTEEAIADADVVILSIPLMRIPDIAPLIRNLPAETTVVDTSNYYPHRDDRIESIDEGQVESLWVTEALGRPVVKAWNAIGSHSFAAKSSPVNSVDRIAIPVAADNEEHKEIGMMLVQQTGFDAKYSGTLAESWRQQPGSPSYCTDLTYEELGPALTTAEKNRLPKRRDIAIEAILERMGDSKTNPSADYLVSLNRVLFM